MSTLVVLNEAAVKRLKIAVETDLDLIVWVGDWLSHLNMFSDAQIYDILKFVKPELEKLESAASNGKLQAATLAVCDSRWVSFSGMNSFLNTETTEIVSAMSEFAVTHIICDVTALRTRMIYRQGRFNAHSKPSGDSTPTELHETE